MYTGTLIGMSFNQPSEEELSAVQRLRDRLSNDFPEGCKDLTDTAILRFLRGRKNIEEKAFRALVHHLNWRKDNTVNSIGDNLSSFEGELNSNKIVVKGFDKCGNPAVFIYAGRHNKNKRNLDELRLLIIYTLETILKKAKPESERIVLCFDLSGFSYSCMDYDAVKVLINVLQYNYPETLNVALIVNAPFLFSACWAVIRPWLDPVTAAKALFIKGDQLHDHFDPSTITSEV